MSLMERFRLDGKVALITGGAGLYGRQLVDGMASAGAITYVASRNLDALEEFAAEQRGLGHDVRALRLDQGDEESIKTAREAIRADVGALHILVNNAVARPVRDGIESPMAAFDESMHINGTGLIIITREMGELLADGGSVINIGSMMGLVGVEPLNYRGTEMHGWYPDYFFHKGGMANLTRFFASFFGPRGIRVNCVHPGGLENEGQDPRFKANYAERTCLGRLAGPHDLEGIVVFLASDASSYITGANIPVDGGYTAK
jgi:NAD(P)-dependent dehydrogenase (short-subunit alcohol dehydrogenase family)